MTKGSWRVTYFFDKQDETSDFSGYSFVFSDGGDAVASKGGASVDGTWGAAGPLDELNEDWRIVESHCPASKITREHISAGNGDTDSLILERI